VREEDDAQYQAHESESGVVCGGQQLFEHEHLRAEMERFEIMRRLKACATGVAFDSIRCRMQGKRIGGAGPAQHRLRLNLQGATLRKKRLSQFSRGLSLGENLD
jgi:hypothetical protein